MLSKRGQRERQQARPSLMGVGLDGDGHKRITKAPDYVLIGGTQETHEAMQETSAHLEEEARKRGKTIGELAPEEFKEIITKL